MVQVFYLSLLCEGGKLCVPLSDWPFTKSARVIEEEEGLMFEKAVQAVKRWRSSNAPVRQKTKKMTRLSIAEELR